MNKQTHRTCMLVADKLSLLYVSQDNKHIQLAIHQGPVTQYWGKHSTSEGATFPQFRGHRIRQRRPSMCIIITSLFVRDKRSVTVRRRFAASVSKDQYRRTSCVAPHYIIHGKRGVCLRSGAGFVFLKRD
jgi:hypothetical protein